MIIDVLLIAGLTLFFVGAILGVLNYSYYLTGRQEHIIETRIGPYYLAEEPSGIPGRKSAAIAGAIGAGVGLILVISALTIKLVPKKVKHGGNDDIHNLVI